MYAPDINVLENSKFNKPSQRSSSTITTTSTINNNHNNNNRTISGTSSRFCSTTPVNFPNSAAPAPPHSQRLRSKAKTNGHTAPISRPARKSLNGSVRTCISSSGSGSGGSSEKTNSGYASASTHSYSGSNIPPAGHNFMSSVHSTSKVPKSIEGNATSLSTPATTATAASTSLGAVPITSGRGGSARKRSPERKKKLSKPL